MALNIQKKIFLVVYLALLLLGSIGYGAESGCPAKCTIYFYNPESNINNYASLKVSFDTHLAKLGNYQFQPFDDDLIFEHTIESDRNGIFLLSSWHYRMLQKRLSLQPVLIGVSNGTSTQRKVLSSNRQITELEQLDGKSIAVSGSKSYSESLLAQMFDARWPSLLPSVRLLSVPKDLDALMAVGFGMASAALTTEKSLENLKKINPKQYQMLGSLGVSEASFLTLAVIPKRESNHLAALLAVMQNMGASPDGGNNLKMLGLDEWRSLTPSEQKALEP